MIRQYSLIRLTRINTFIIVNPSQKQGILLGAQEGILVQWTNVLAPAKTSLLIKFQKKLPNFCNWNPPPLNLSLTLPSISQNSFLTANEVEKGSLNEMQLAGILRKKTMIQQWQWMTRDTIYQVMYLKYWIWWNVV